MVAGDCRTAVPRGGCRPPPLRLRLAAAVGAGLTAMVGIFARWQPKYADHGIATFPVREKRPAVRGYLRMGLSASASLVDRFKDANGLGIACRRNRLTIVDVDSPDEKILAAALDAYGPTPFIVRSGSGNFQAWYRHGGERRRIRPDPSRPIDILGDGFVVAPPSRGKLDCYSIIQGTLDDLNDLPTLRAHSSTEPDGNAKQKIERGGRNDALWRACMREAARGGTFQELLTKANEINELEFYERLPADEVKKTVVSAWSKEQKGDNWFGRGGHTTLDNVDHIDRMMRDHHDALILLTVLRRHNWGERDFVIANGMHEMVGMTRKGLAAARKFLVDIGELVMVRPPARNSPGLYRLKGGQN